jgi:hypothetical protein
MDCCRHIGEERQARELSDEVISRAASQMDMGHVTDRSQARIRM